MMRPKTLPIFAILLFARFAAAEDPPPVTVARVEEILAQARPFLDDLLGQTWPEDLTIEKADRARLTVALEPGFLRVARSHYPGRSEASLRHIGRVMARSFADIRRLVHDEKAKRILVSEGAILRLPPGVSPDHALTWLVLREAVLAMDFHAADLGRLFAAAGDPERSRALRMLVQGRAEHFASRVAGLLGVPADTGRALLALSGPLETFIVEGGRRFVAAVEDREKGLSGKALRAPPDRTSVVFHPADYPDGPKAPELLPALAKAGFTLRPTIVSEFDMRVEFETLLSPEAAVAAFEGFLGAADAGAPGGARASLAAFREAAAAERFREALAGLRGPGFAILSRGVFCAASTAAGDEDPAELLHKVLEAATGE